MPELVKDGLIFWPIPDITDGTVVFGLDAHHYFDRRKRPKVPKHYEDTVENLFFRGGILPIVQDGVDRTKATRYFRAMLSSFIPPHESKVSTAAYALWVWTEGDLTGS